LFRQLGQHAVQNTWTQLGRSTRRFDHRGQANWRHKQNSCGRCDSSCENPQKQPPAVSKNGTTTAVYQTTRICGVHVRDESARRKRFHVDRKGSAGAPEASAIYFLGEVQ